MKSKVLNPLPTTTIANVGPSDSEADERQTLSEQRSANREGAAGVGHAGGPRGARDSATNATSKGGMSSALSEETTLSQMANLDLKYTNPLVQFWLHLKIWVRLIIMLMVPFIAMIILLVVAISANIKAEKSASDVFLLSTVADHCILVVHELSTEFTSALWWTLDPTLQSGIGWSSGGLTGKGFSYEFELTSIQLDPMLQYLNDHPVAMISTKLAATLYNLVDQLRTLDEFRYSIQLFQRTSTEINTFYLALINGLIDAADLIATLSDSSTVQKAQGHISWVRMKTAMELERHTVGLVLLTKSFTTAAYSEWMAQIALQSQWKQRFLSIAPDEMTEQALTFFSSEIMRELQELRLSGLAAYVPNDTSSLPPFSFSAWMKAAGSVADEMRDFRVRLAEDILRTATQTKNSCYVTLSLFILLAVLCSLLSVGVGLVVGWSIDTPWKAMVRMQNRIIEKLKEEEKRNAVTDGFVPTEFFTLMGAKTLFDVNIGNCALKRATVVCSEIRNFGKLSERMAPQQCFMFVSTYLQDTGAIVHRHGGFIERFRGSGCTAIFTDPNEAIDAGLELLEWAQLRNQDGGAMSSVVMDLGVTVHVGDLMLGTVGDEHRMDITIISDAITTSLQMVRLVSLYDVKMLLSRDTFLLCATEGLTVRFLGETGCGNLKKTLQVYEVLTQQNGEAKLNTLDEFNQAIKIHQAGDFSGAAQLYESVLVQNPADAVASRRLKLAQNQEWIDKFDAT